MFKKLQRTLDRKKQGKVPFKMRFVVHIKQVTGLPNVFSKARVQWARGQKVAMTQTVAAVKGVATFNESLEQIATVYKDSKNHMESKEYSLKLQVPSKNDEEKMVTLGKADVDMTAFVSVDKGVKDASVRIPYKVGKDLSGTLTFSVSTELIQVHSETGKCAHSLAVESGKDHRRVQVGIGVAKAAALRIPGHGSIPDTRACNTGSRDLDGMTEATGVTGLSAGLSEDLAQDLSGFEDPGTPSSSGHGAPFEPHRASSSDRGAAAAAAAAAARSSGKGQTAADIAKAAIQEKDLQLQRARAEADRLRAQLELLQEQQQAEDEKAAQLDTVQEGEEEEEARGGGAGPSQEEWDQLQREREELEQGLAKQREGEAQLQAKLEELSASLAAATLLQQQEADKSGEKISELEEALQEARQASSAAEEADAAQQQLEEKVRELQAQLEGLEQEREELEAACSTQEQSQERLQALLEETKQAAEAAQERLREREAEAAQLAEECSLLKEQLTSADTDLQGEKAAALTLGTQLAAATQDADGLRERVAELEVRASADQEEKQEMQLAFGSAETQYQLLEQDQAKALEELEQSRKDVQELRTKLARIGAATSAGYQFLRSGSGGAENGHAEDADEQGAEPGSEESAADMMQTLVADLQKEVDSTRSERDASVQELQATRQQLLDLQQRSQAMGLQLEQSKEEADKVRELEAERGELERAVMSAESLVVERDSELQALRQHLDQTMEGKQAAEQQVDELTQEVSQLQEASAAGMQQLDEIRATLQDAEAKASEQEKGAAAALSDLAAMQAVRAGMLADMELANAKRSEVESEKQMLEEAMAELEAQLGEEQAARERLELRLREAADGEEGAASTQLAAELEERERRLAALEEELQGEREELQTQLLEARDQIMALERGLAQSQQGQKDLQNENMQLQEELQRAGDEAYEISRTVQRSRPQTPADALQDSAGSGTSRLAREVEDMRVENDRIAHELVLVKLALAEKVEEELVMKRELHRAKEKAISLAHRATKWETAFYSKGR